MSIPNQQPSTDARDQADKQAVAQATGQASGQHQGLHHPDENQRIKQALNDADLADLGESAEDQLRDRRGRGLPNSSDVSSSDEQERSGNR